MQPFHCRSAFPPTEYFVLFVTWWFSMGYPPITPHPGGSKPERLTNLSRVSCSCVNLKRGESTLKVDQHFEGQLFIIPFPRAGSFVQLRIPFKPSPPVRVGEGRVRGVNLCNDLFFSHQAVKQRHQVSRRNLVS